MAKGGLTKWFAEEWVDVKTGKKCGRSGKEKKKRPYPSCRPKAVAAKMTKLKKLLLLVVKQALKQLNTQSQLQVDAGKLQETLDKPLKV